MKLAIRFAHWDHWKLYEIKKGVKLICELDFEEMHKILSGQDIPIDVNEILEGVVERIPRP